MKDFKVLVSQNAQNDLDDLTNFIAFDLKSPLTSLRYTNGIIAEMKKLKLHANSIAISTQIFVLRYGNTARRVNYKKHTIIYTIQDKYVIIERIIASALIID